MDPNFGVLLGDSSATDGCDKSKSTTSNSSINKTALIAVLVTLFGILLLGALIYVLVIPRVREYLQIKKGEAEIEEEMTPTRERSKSRAATQTARPESFHAHKRQDMEVSTVAGRFIVEM